MNKPSPVHHDAVHPMKTRRPARDKAAQEGPAVLVDERWRAWVFGQEDPAPRCEPRADAQRASRRPTRRSP